MSKSNIEFKIKNKHAISDIINNSSFDYNRPKCNNVISFVGSQVGSQITCPWCKTIINLEDDNFKNSINNLDNSFNNIFK